MSSIRIAIVEDDKELLAALATIFRGTSGFQLVSTHGSGEEAIDSLNPDSVDIVLVDLSLKAGGVDGVEVIRRLRKERRELLLCTLTVHEDTDRIFSSLRAGANGYILKKTPPAALLEALVDLANGGSPMSPAIARKVTQHFNDPTGVAEQAASLSDRQREVLELLSRGKTNKEVAEKLGVSVNTVRSHVRAIYLLLEVHTGKEAVAKYLRGGEGGIRISREFPQNFAR
jgi:DNA-binding NarL/FixJ family response regulator